jgi:hypothetical protein
MKKARERSKEQIGDRKARRTPRSVLRDCAKRWPTSALLAGECEHSSCTSEWFARAYDANAAMYLVERVMCVCSHARTALAKRTSRMRSVFLHAGRFTCRLRMKSCCRKSAFSAMSSDLLLPRSAMVPRSTEGVNSFVHRTKRVLSLAKRRRIRCLR